MISKSRLQEFGFTDEESFPKRLTHHAVTLSLPSAMDNGVEPLGVYVEDGLVVPFQGPAHQSGMIIRRDGMVLHVGHKEADDPSSPLEAKFINDIPYDVRVRVSHVMRRAVGADPSLAVVWDVIRKAWVTWFPLAHDRKAYRLAGAYNTADQSWTGVAALIAQLGRTASSSSGEGLWIRVILQRANEFEQGWLGEEIVVDEVLATAISKGFKGHHERRVFLRLQEALRSPVFDPRSTFRLFYGSRGAHVVKLVVMAPGGILLSVSNAAGIELGSTFPNGLPPSLA